MIVPGGDSAERRATNKLGTWVLRTHTLPTVLLRTMPVLPAQTIPTSSGIGVDSGKSAQFAAGGFSLALMGAAFAFSTCYFREFIFPNTPFLPWADAVGFLNNGTRIVAGRLPYRDYFAFLPPGTELTYAFLIREFGAHAWIPALMMVCLAAVTVLLMTLLAGQVIRGRAVILPGLLLVGFALPGAMDATHHWFSTVGVLAASLILLSGSTWPRIAAVGILCGIAACYTQNKGALAVLGFIVYLTWKMYLEATSRSDCWRKSVVLFGLSAAVFIAVNAYFIKASGLHRWLYCIIVFPLRYYPSVSLNSWRVYGHGLGGLRLGIIPFLFIHAAVPLVYIFSLVAIYRGRKKEPGQPWNQLLLISVTGMAMFLAIASSPSWKRLSTVSPPAMILLVWFLSRPGRVRTGYRIGLATAAVILALAAAVRTQTRWHAYLNLPVGRTALDDSGRYEEYGYMLGHTHPGQLFFGTPPVLFAFKLQNPAPIDVFVTAEYTRPEQVSATIQTLERFRVPMLMLNRQMYEQFVATSPSDHLDPLRAYLLQSYRLTKRFQADDELWERYCPKTQ